MANYSAGQRWEYHNQKQQAAEYQEREAQRDAANQAVRAQVEGLPSLMSFSHTLPVGRLKYYQDSRSNLQRRHEDVAELEAQAGSPPQYRQQAALTPPASRGDGPEVYSNEQIRHLQEEVLRKENSIRRLESDLEYEKGNRRGLQAERHEAVDAQRRADDEICRLKRKVANLDQLLEESIQRQKKLESDLDLCRQESSELKRQLHEERESYESDIRARERRERQTKPQLEQLEHVNTARVRRPDRDVGQFWMVRHKVRKARSLKLLIVGDKLTGF